MKNTFMQNTINEIAYSISSDKVTFLEVSAERKNNIWEYTETGSWFRSRPVDGMVNDFLQKALAVKHKRSFSEVSTILCNAAYAIALYAKGIITEEMILSIKQGVVGAGRGLTSIVSIPKQEITLWNEKFMVSICIVDCFSYESFTFIDRNDKDM